MANGYEILVLYWVLQKIYNLQIFDKRKSLEDCFFMLLCNT